MQFVKKLGSQCVRCPQCHTLYALFRKTTLTPFNTVSCGTCQQVFVALDHLAHPTKPWVVPNKHNPYQAKLLSADTPAIVNSSGSTVSRFINKLHRWRSVLLGAGLFFVINLAIALLLTSAGGSMLQNPFMRSWLTTVCGLVGCDAANYHDAASLVIQQHTLITTASSPPTLLLQALVKNAGLFPQQLGDLELEIRDLGGRVVQTLMLTPTEYTSTLTGQPLEPGHTVNIAVTLNQPMPNVFSYQLHFR